MTKKRGEPKESEATVTLSVKGQKINLTAEEARAIFDSLYAVFGYPQVVPQVVPYFVPYVVPYVVPKYGQPLPWPEYPSPWTWTCQSAQTTTTSSPTSILISPSKLDEDNV